MYPNTFIPAAFAEPDSSQRDRLIQYLADVGITEAVELQTAALRRDYEEIYTELPPSFWKDDRLATLFDNYIAATLESYVVVMQDEFTAEEIEFLIQFYISSAGQRAIRLSKRMTPAFVQAGSEINMDFSRAFVELIGDIAKEAQEGASDESEQST